ncbi:hypothetical protein FKG94_27740 [Exilibacterium tricleocarpae]|uniref:DUF6316 domain-containing protein n=1 Tax=Exilibacterium tricleocarpae TaxID=2591008 RepID=A0A545SLZ2_9GAMM|nr:DUF6316 family protein [Exilibacterium tricleocarpae]TQV65988.1 hypothetical protein FKG94_27740 [Exilibacterium tricleocarpae]
MTSNRSGEYGEVPVRNERVFQKNSYWYYTTREGVDIGPFDSRVAAEAGAEEFVDFILSAGPSMIATLEQYGKRAA